MNSVQKTMHNESGFVLIAALIFLVILSLIGIAGLTTSSFEQEIAGNDWSAKRNFYRADGGLDLGSELLEYSFSCQELDKPGIKEKILIVTPILYEKEDAPTGDYPSDANRDLCWPTADCSDDSQKEHTNIIAYGTIDLIAGDSQNLGGYGAATLGAEYKHNIHAQHINPGRGGESIIESKWRHIVGKEDPNGCYYR